MKNIFINNARIDRNHDEEDKLLERLRFRFGSSVISPTGVEVFSDAEPRRLGAAVYDYIEFITEYFRLILSDNEVAEARKESPYALFVSLTLDTFSKKVRLHIYLDEAIFGLVAGSGYMNIVSLIRTSFPFYSKIGAEVELKLFSLEDSDSNFTEG